MASRFVANCSAALLVILISTVSFAAEPLVVAELRASRKIAVAEASKSDAEHELAAWKLRQLRELREAGHASWQEVAQQEVMVHSLSAAAEAAQQYVHAVAEWQSRIAKLLLRNRPQEAESIQLFLPGSNRLVASIPTEFASRELAKRHLENLRSEHQSVSDIDLSSLETAITKAEKALQIYGAAERNASRCQRAAIELRIAQAAYQSAQARQASAKIIARRMSLVRELPNQQPAEPEPSSEALAEIGTRFVDATSDRELALLVNQIAIGETSTSAQIERLKQKHTVITDRIDALKQLSEHARFNPTELAQAKQRRSDLESQIQVAQGILEVKQRLAERYQQKSRPQASERLSRAEPLALDDPCFSDANTVRHLLTLLKLKLQTAADQAVIKAELDYLVQRLQRVEQIPEAARPPQELNQLDQKVKGVREQLAMVARDLTLLDREQQRFCRQVKAQQGQQYQLVQAGHGQFIGRQQFELAASLIGSIGMVEAETLFPELSAMYPYLESPTVLDCLSELSIEVPGPTTQIDKLTRWGSSHDRLRLGTPSLLQGPDRCCDSILIADRTVFARDLFCYWPCGLWRVRPDQLWYRYDYLPWASNCGLGYLACYDRWPLGPSGQNIFSYRFGAPTRCSFPYRSSYLYRTAFPLRSNLYSYPYARPAGLVSSCYD